MSESFLGRLLDKFTIGDDCWEWTGARIPEGYGVIMRDGQNVGAHRAMYEYFVGPIPEGHQIDHLCKNTGCVRPGHLEAVTGWENRRRGNSPWGVNARREECASGHEFTEENTYIRTNGHRTCRECVRQANRAWKAKRRANT